jgi:hypothetical protein
MKIKVDKSFYQTCSTEQAAALMSIGFDLLKPDPALAGITPICREFTKHDPPAVGWNRLKETPARGIRRGGKVWYTFDTSGTEYDNPAQEIADAYADKTPSDVVDETLAELKERTRGTAVGQLVEKLIDELPREYARYIRAGMENRRNLIGTIEKEEIPEWIKVRNRHGFYVRHDARMSPDLVKQLFDA